MITNIKMKLKSNEFVFLSSWNRRNFGSERSHASDTRFLRKVKMHDLFSQNDIKKREKKDGNCFENESKCEEKRWGVLHDLNSTDTYTNVTKERTNRLWKREEAEGNREKTVVYYFLFSMLMLWLNYYFVMYLLIIIYLLGVSFLFSLLFLTFSYSMLELICT